MALAAHADHHQPTRRQFVSCVPAILGGSAILSACSALAHGLAAKARFNAGADKRQPARAGTGQRHARQHRARINPCEGNRYGTYASAQYTASQIAGAKLVGFDEGGHTWVGHNDEVMAEIIKLLAPPVDR